MKIDLTSNGFLFYENKVLLIYHKNYDLWIGVGGHIEENETPDENLKREFLEEIGVEINILSAGPKFNITDNIIEQSPIPFNADTHKVKDHIHYAQYYICTPKTNNFVIKPDESEIKILQWFSKDEVLNNVEINQYNKNNILYAFEVYKKLVKR